MEEEASATTRYWCHMCSETVDPVMEAEIKCPFCLSGFVEEMEEVEQASSDANVVRANGSIWAPILMEMMNNSARSRRSQSSPESVDVNRNEPEAESETGNGRGTDLDSQLQEILRRRGRRSVSVVQLLQGVRAGLTLAPESEGDDDDNNNTDRERGRVIVINPFNQLVAVPSSAVPDSVPAAALSEYFIGPGFEALLQRLAENDPNRYGTPPARKDAVEALANVKIEEALQCSVCLDDLEIGTVGKQMPCKHSFHSDCLLPWLELHSSCPVCRYEIPADETKTGSATTETSGGNGGGGGSSASSSQGSENSRQEEEEEDEEEEEEENDEGDRTAYSIPWLFSTFFSSSQDSSNP